MRTIHGTPITPAALLEQLRGSSFCVSYAAPGQLDRCIDLVGPTGVVMLDNGAFSAWRSTGHNMTASERQGFYDWANDAMRRCDQAVAVIPDVIEGSTPEANWELAREAVHYGFEFPERAMFVWHMDEPIEQLQKACRLFNFVAIGSCAQYDIQKNFAGYMDRLREAMASIEYVDQFYGRRPWVHAMRGLGQYHRFRRLDSADSTNIARNHCRTKGRPNHVRAMAARIEAKAIWGHA